MKIQCLRQTFTRPRQTLWHFELLTEPKIYHFLLIIPFLCYYRLMAHWGKSWAKCQIKIKFNFVKQLRSFITFALKQNIKCQNSQLLVTKFWREIYLEIFIFLSGEVEFYFFPLNIRVHNIYKLEYFFTSQFTLLC